MRIKKISKLMREIESTSPTDLMRELDITVFEDPSMDSKDKDAVLMTGKSKSVLYIKSNLDEAYRDFILLHEGGHRACHFEPDAQYSFIQSQYVGRMEKEANTFACLFLLKDEELTDVNVIDILRSKGVPDGIACEFSEELMLNLNSLFFSK